MGVTRQSLPSVDMAAVTLRMILVVLLVLSVVSASPVKRSAAPLSLAEGNAESINAMNGFYGNPIYRPYGFGSWGYGSHGYGVHSTTLYGPHTYGGFYPRG